MSALQHWLAGHGIGGLTLAFLVAALMGLRHATDPDHLTAVSTLVLSDRTSGARAAAGHGLAWGLGHGVTLFLFGLPVVMFGAYLPAALQRLAEVAIGLVIVGLALRLLLRWRRGYFHTHTHTHGAVEHAHPHVHEPPHRGRLRALFGADPGVRDHPTSHEQAETRGHPTLHDHAMSHDHPPSHDHAQPSHDHAHGQDLGATPLHAFGVGLLHGVGGSAAAGALLIAAVADGAGGAAALLLYAGTTALAMALVSAGVGQALVWGRAGRGFEAAVPAFAAFGVLFGVWYAMAAL